MKKLISLLLVVLLFAACSTTTVDQTHLYGTVRNVYFYKGYYHAEVWSPVKEKFYNIVTNDWRYQVGDVVLIK